VNLGTVALHTVHCKTCATSDSNGTVQRRRSQRAAELSLALLPAPGQRRVKVTEKGGVAVKRACAPRCHVPGAALWPMALASKRRPAPCMHVPRRLGSAGRRSRPPTPPARAEHTTHTAMHATIGMQYLQPGRRGCSYAENETTTVQSISLTVRARPGRVDQRPACHRQVGPTISGPHQSRRPSLLGLDRC
jgi:hypothetical protein